MGYSQNSLLKKMEAFGYSKKELDGHCYGLSEMAINAFLQGDIEQFRERLEILNELTEADIKALNDPSLWDEGKYNIPFKLSSGETIRPADIFAFFDGVTLYQRPFDFAEIFSDKKNLYQ